MKEEVITLTGDIFAKADDPVFDWMVAHQGWTILLVVLFTVMVQIGGIALAYWYTNVRMSR